MSDHKADQAVVRLRALAVAHRILWPVRSCLAVLVLIPSPAAGQDLIRPDQCRQALRIDVVHGDDPGADFVSNFLTGCDVADASSTGLPPPRCRTNQLHVPASLAGTHLHLPPLTACPNSTDCQSFFWDKNFTTLQGRTGQDNDTKYGLEREAVLFYAGHSEDLSLQAFNGKPVPLQLISLGDECTRYFWSASCRVMAHGPVRSEGAYAGDYIDPGGFDPADRNQVNVFERWGATSQITRSSPLNRRLRMACGGSSDIGGGPHPTEDVWRYLLIERLPPAESFLLGMLEPVYPAVPLCIARGGKHPWRSPIFDAVFRTHPASRPRRHLWIEFPVNQKSAFDHLKDRLGPWLRLEPEPETSPPPPPGEAPVLNVKEQQEQNWLKSLSAADTPVTQRSFGFETHRLGREGDPLIANLIKPADVCVASNPESGAVVISWRPLESPAFDLQRLSPDHLVPELAPRLGLFAPTGPPGAPVAAFARVIDLQLRSIPVAKLASLKKKEEVQQATGCRFYLFRPTERVDNTDVQFLGPGAQWFWGICPPSRQQGEGAEPEVADPCKRTTPALLTISVLARAVQENPAADKVGVFNPDEARGMIAALFPEGLAREDYEEVRYRWGYKAAPLHCRQDKQYLVYEFDLRPKHGTSPALGPLTIEVPAHKLCDAKNPQACFAAMEEAWHCAKESNGE